MFNYTANLKGEGQMKTTTFRIVTLLLAACLIMFLTSCKEQKTTEQTQAKAVQKQAQTYKLGLSLAITGPTSDAGNPYSKGVEDYFNYVNEEKLLGDDTIECTIRDDQYKTDVTKRNFEDFIAQGIVLYLNYSTGSTMGLKKDFEEEKIAVIPASFHAGNLVDSNYIFLPIASYSEQMVCLAEYVANHHAQGMPKAAMFIHPSVFGRGPVDDTKKAVEAGLNMEIVEVVEHGQGLDNTATLTRLVSKGVQYVLCQTVQSPVATLLKDAQRLGLVAQSFGEPGKITFMGCHYTGGNDLIALAGDAAENFFWTTSYTVTSEKSAGTTAQLALAERYGRDDKAANSHNYANGIMVAQVATEAIRRVKAKGMEVNKENLYNELNAMNGYNAYYPLTTVGPVTFSAGSDHAGVDYLQIYTVKNGVFKTVGSPIKSEFMTKI